MLTKDQLASSRAALAEAIKKIPGGQTKIAEVTGYGQSSVSFWLNESKKGVPVECVPAIAELASISKHRLRPDFFPKEKTDLARDGEALEEGASS